MEARDNYEDPDPGDVSDAEIKKALREARLKENAEFTGSLVLKNTQEVEAA